jgi:hypothetical protein
MCRSSMSKDSGDEWYLTNCPTTQSSGRAADQTSIAVLLLSLSPARVACYYERA